MDGRTDGQADESKDEWADGQTDGRNSKQTKLGVNKTDLFELQKLFQCRRVVEIRTR